MDFDDVIADLDAGGFVFDAAWFEPHFEFRFPLVGEIATSGIALTIRSALEPWHVMGEEGSPGGTVRYVDLSVERIGVRARGRIHRRCIRRSASTRRSRSTSSTHGRGAQWAVASIMWLIRVDAITRRSR